MEFIMKLCFSTLGCPDWDFETIVKNAADTGFCGVEVRGIKDELMSHLIPAFLPENQDETNELLKRNGVKICGLGTSVSFQDFENRAAKLDEGRRAVDLCRQMNIPFARVFGDYIVDQHTVGNVISGIAELCEYSHGSGVKLLLEVHGSFNTVEMLTPVVEELKGYDNFGIIWDVANSDMVYGKNYRAFYDFIRPYTAHIHITDHVIDEDKISHKIIGEGDVPIREIVRELLTDGFDGCFSLEWEKRWHRELAEPEEVFPQFIRFMESI